jgi:hypothetical protein
MKRSGKRHILQRLVRWIFGNDEYADGQHIAHDPSWWQRRKARRDTTDWMWRQIPSVIEIAFTANTEHSGESSSPLL